jgi:peptidyl-dipeptidase Dcp
MELLERVWTPAKAAADRERQALEAFIRRTEPQAADGEGIQIDPWDWRFYAEKVRQAEYDFDESVLKPYMSLDHMTNAIFDVANQLFGLVFVYREDIPGYHPDVKVYEVFEEGVGENGTNRFVGLFLHGMHALPLIHMLM